MADVDTKQLRMINEAPLIYPDRDKVKRSVAGSLENYEALLHLSWEKPEEFWSRVAADLWWMKPWERVMEGALPDFRFFVGGVSNVCYNLLDRHLEKGYDNKLALIWEGEDHQTRFYTYRMLQAEVNKCANALKSLGVQKGDRVAIFLPNLAETVIAVLACYRLGVLFNTVFSGFSVSALRDRLIHYEPRLIVTADGGYRRGQPIPLKEKVDQAVSDMESVKTVVVVRRTGMPVRMATGTDYWWHELIKDQSLICPPEPVEANEPGLVFYTSGTTGKPKGVVHAGLAFLVNNYIYAKYHMDFHDHDMFWCTADIGWLTMHIWGIVGSLVNGVTTIFYEGAIDYPGPERFYEIIHTYRVNKLFTVPTLIRMLMRHGEGLMKDFDLSCLDVVTLVGEPFNPEAWYWTYEKLGRKQIYVNNTYGQTELAGCPLANAAWMTPMKPGSCGTEFLAAKLEIVDGTGQPVPPGTPGNLVMTRPIPMLVRTL